MAASNDNSEQQISESASETPGMILKAARNKAGITPEDLAKALNISVAKLHALEADDYDKLASDVFAQGYLRQYGKLVGVDEDLLVDRFRQCRARQRETEGANSETGLRSAGPLVPRWTLPAAIFAAALVLLVFVFMQATRDEATGPSLAPPAAIPTEQRREHEPQPEPDEEVLPEAVELLPPPVEFNQVERPAAEPQSTIQSPAPPVETAAAPARPAETETETEAASPVQGQLSLSFTDECWVEVRDASGRVLRAEVAVAGQSMSLEGQAPFSIMLGNARAASLLYNGEVVPVNPRPGNRTARVTVGP